MKYFIVVLFSTLAFIEAIYAQMVNVAEGKQIFMSRCTSCHAINREVVGPALRDVEKRHTEQWIINFVHSSQTVIKSGDKAAMALFQSHNNTIMPDHPDLKNEQIQSIIAFIKDQSGLAPPVMSGNNLSFRKSYKKASLLHQIIYLNIEGNHVPIRPGDTFSWILIGFIVFLIIAVLYLVVLANQVIDQYYERTKSRRLVDKRDVNR
jgi:cytochrome c2